MARSTTIEILIGSEWKTLDAEDALTINEKYGRCVHCKRPAVAYAQGKNGEAAHVEHKTWNKHCPLRHRRKSESQP